MKTVLVVEDTEDLRDLFVEVLRREGYRALAAENGQAALDILRSGADEPCLVLLDMMMPVMDGKMFLKHVRTLQRAATLSIVVLSAAMNARDVRGAAACVKKPVAPDVLLALVREHCGPP